MFFGYGAPGAAAWYSPPIHSRARHGACEDYDEKLESPPVAAVSVVVDRFRIDRQILLNRSLAVNEARELGPISLMKSLHKYCAGCDAKMV
jgi:hypothetical protein